MKERQVRVGWHKTGRQKVGTDGTVGLGTGVIFGPTWQLSLVHKRKYDNPFHKGSEWKFTGGYELSWFNWRQKSSEFRDIIYRFGSNDCVIKWKLLRGRVVSVGMAENRSWYPERRDNSIVKKKDGPSLTRCYFNNKPTEESQDEDRRVVYLPFFIPLA